jgi:hypothetical protein
MDRLKTPKTCRLVTVTVTNRNRELGTSNFLLQYLLIAAAVLHCDLNRFVSITAHRTQRTGLLITENESQRIERRELRERTERMASEGQASLRFCS